MKKILLTLLILGFGLIGRANLPLLDPELRAELSNLGQDEKIKVVILMSDQADAQALIREARFYPTKQARRQYVVETLKCQAEASQRELMTLLTEMEANGLVSEIRPLWIVNSICCYATSEAVHSIEDHLGIMSISSCKPTPYLFDEETLPASRGDGREIAENLLKVNADQVWNQGYTGQGVLIGHIDTGINLNHADLQGRLWDGGPDYPNHGYDFYSHDDDPSDTHGHGTHVAGTIVGTGASGTHTGVAPDAKIMALKVFHGEDNLTEPTMCVEAMQFAVEHGASVLNMSLGQPLPDSGVKLMMRQACDNTLAAGVVAAVCAGNTRQIQMLAPVPYNIWSPGDCPPPHLHEDQMVNPGGTSCVVCVGAVDFNDALGGFSSEGPSVWTDVSQYHDYPYSSGSSTNIGLIRPDVCAPGVNIKSLDISTTDGYCLKSGTSMATPCVAGTIALMLSKNPELTPAEIDEILERTAVPLSAHKSNDFGSGRIDALAAVNAVPAWDGLSENTLIVRVYPNPSTDYVTICAQGLQRVEILDITGKKLITAPAIQNELSLDLRQLVPGIYFVTTVTEHGLLTQKLVKTKH